MALANVEEATERYRRKLESGYFSNPRSKNTETDYSTYKEDRDTKAICDFAKSDLFQALIDRS